MRRSGVLSVIKHLFCPQKGNNHRARLWHHSALVWILVINVMGFAWVNSLSHSYPQVLGYASSISPEEIVQLTNQQRQQRGLGKLKTNSALTQAAIAKAQDMFAKDYWSHVSPTGDQPWKFIRQAGYYYTYAGENLARDFDTSSQVVAAWMNSPGHRKNILNPNYLEIGVAVMDGTLQGKQTTLVVQMFGQRRVAVASNTQSASQPTPTVPPRPTATPTPKLLVTATPTPASVSALLNQPEDKPPAIASVQGSLLRNNDQLVIAESC